MDIFPMRVIKAKNRGEMVHQKQRQISGMDVNNGCPVGIQIKMIQTMPPSLLIQFEYGHFETDHNIQSIYISCSKWNLEQVYQSMGKKYLKVRKRTWHKMSTIFISKLANKFLLMKCLRVFLLLAHENSLDVCDTHCVHSRYSLYSHDLFQYRANLFKRPFFLSIDRSFSLIN